MLLQINLKTAVAHTKPQGIHKKKC